MSWADGDDDAALLRAALDSLDAWDDNGHTMCGDVSVVSLLVGDVENPDGWKTDASNTTTDSLSDGGSSPSGNDTLVTAQARFMEAVTERSQKSRSTASATRQFKPSTLASTTHKRQNEILYLKDKVEELQQELAVLKAKKEDSDTTVERSDINREVTLMWQGIVGRHKQMRHQAEVEQMRLQRLLEMQVNVSQQLVQAFQAVRNMEDEFERHAPKRQRFICTPTPASQRERDQLAELEIRYRDIHSQFTQPKFNDGTMRFLDIQVMEDCDGSTVIEFQDSAPVPFATRQVLDALWKDTLRGAEKKWEHSPDTDVDIVRDDGVHIVRFVLSGDATAEGHFTAKRFYNDEYPTPAIVAITHGTPIPNRGKGMHFREDVWLRIVPAPSYSFKSKSDAASATRSYPLTLVQCIRRFRFAFEDSMSMDAGDQDPVGFLTNMVLAKLKGDVESKHEVLEMLLSDARS